MLSNWQAQGLQQACACAQPCPLLLVPCTAGQVPLHVPRPTPAGRLLAAGAAGAGGAARAGGPAGGGGWYRWRRSAGHAQRGTAACGAGRHLERRAAAARWERPGGAALALAGCGAWQQQGTPAGRRTLAAPAIQDGQRQRGCPRAAQPHQQAAAKAVVTGRAWHRLSRQQRRTQSQPGRCSAGHCCWSWQPLAGAVWAGVRGARPLGHRPAPRLAADHAGLHARPAGPADPGACRGWGVGCRQRMPGVAWPLGGGRMAGLLASAWVALHAWARSSLTTERAE